MSIADRVNREIARDNVRREALGDMLTRRADGRFDVADTRAANAAYGCTVDDWCVLQDGHEGECNHDRDAMHITSATFDTISGVVSIGLTGTNPLVWARQIKTLYPSVEHVVVEPNGRVRAMHHGGQPFTLGWVRVHRATTTEEI